MKILHLPTSVGGNAYGLSRGERQLGHDSEVLVSLDTYFQYPADRVLSSNWDTSIKGYMRFFLRTMREFLDIRSKYDVLHFNSGSSLFHFPWRNLNLLELPFYNKNTKIVVTYNGCDARQKELSKAHNPSSPCHHDDCYDGRCNNKRFEAGKIAALQKMQKYASTTFALNPDLFNYMPSHTKFLPYTVSSWNDIHPIPRQIDSASIKIVHAPTNRIVKGSDEIIAAISKLKAKYKRKIEFTLIENLSNREALVKYAEADLAIDQIRLGWYGGLAVECMKAGTPVAVYISKNDLKFLPPEMAKEATEALIDIDSNTIYEKIRKFVEQPELLLPYRSAVLDYVHRWHDPVKVAAKVLVEYQR